MPKLERPNTAQYEELHCIKVIQKHTKSKQSRPIQNIKVKSIQSIKVIYCFVLDIIN